MPPCRIVALPTTECELLFVHEASLCQILRLEQWHFVWIESDVQVHFHIIHLSSSAGPIFAAERFGRERAGHADTGMVVGIWLPHLFSPLVEFSGNRFILTAYHKEQITLMRQLASPNARD